jgi:hypothetical protein
METIDGRETATLSEYILASATICFFLENTSFSDIQRRRERERRRSFVQEESRILTSLSFTASGLATHTWWRYIREGFGGMGQEIGLSV